MNLEEIENKHYEFQIGMYFSEAKQIEGTQLMYSNIVEDFYWNYATKINSTNPEKLLKEVEEFFKKINRIPAIYITPWSKPENFTEIAEKMSYKNSASDAWMIYKGEKQEISENIEIKEVKTEQEMQTLLEVFEKSYSDPDDPYGIIPPAYKEALLKSFDNKGKKIIHYLGFSEGKPVGLSTLIHNNEYGGIYNIGSIPKIRKKGIGTAISLHPINQAIDKGCKYIFLQTVPKSYNEKFYTKLGFETQFIGTAYVKK